MDNSVSLFGDNQRDRPSIDVIRILPEFSIPVMECLSGSYLYGTNDENSDIDTRGVFVPPTEYLIGLKHIEQIQDLKKDICIYDIRKFFNLALQCNPNIVEILFIPTSNLVYCSDIWREILSIRECFLSKRIKNTIMGYAISEIKKIERGATNPLKKLSHVYRLVYEGVEILQTGYITLPRPEAYFLKSIRMGYYAQKDLLITINDLEARLDIKTSLPEKPDFERVNQLCQDILSKILNSRMLPNGARIFFGGRE